MKRFSSLPDWHDFSSEAASVLSPKRLFLNEVTIRLEPGETKNGEGRTTYMEPDLLSMMSNLFKKRGLGCLCVFQHDGEHISDFREAWDSACETAKIPGMVFHDLRRAAVRYMVRAALAMAISGHKARAVFDRYSIVSKDDLKEAVLTRAKFNPPLSEWLHFGYIRHRIPKKVVTLKAATS